MKPSSPQTSSADAASTLPGKLVRYGAGVSALAAVVGLPAHSAQATVFTFSGNQFSGDPIYLDITQATPGSVSNSPFNAAQFDLYTTSGPASSTKPTVKGLNGAQVDVSGFADGMTVSSSDTFEDSAGFVNTDGSPEDFYVGLRIPDQAGAATDYFYGYVHFTDNGTPLTFGLNPSATTGTLTIDDYGYNDTPNAPITVPEPNAMALLIAGAAGVGILAARRRKESGTIAG